MKHVSLPSPELTDCDKATWPRTCREPYRSILKWTRSPEIQTTSFSVKYCILSFLESSMPSQLWRHVTLTGFQHLAQWNSRSVLPSSVFERYALEGKTLFVSYLTAHCVILSIKSGEKDPLRTYPCFVLLKAMLMLLKVVVFNIFKWKLTLMRISPAEK